MNRGAVIGAGAFAVLAGIVLSAFSFQTVPGRRGGREAFGAVLAVVLLVSGSVAATIGIRMPDADGKNTSSGAGRSTPPSVPASASPSASSPSASSSTASSPSASSSPSPTAPVSTGPSLPASLRPYELVHRQKGYDLDGDGRADLYRTSPTSPADQIQAFLDGTRPIYLLPSGHVPDCTEFPRTGAGNLKMKSLAPENLICLRGTSSWILILVEKVPKNSNESFSVRAGAV
jgi:hypothetical protein